MRIKLANRELAKALTTLGAVGALAAGGVAVSGCGASATLDPIARAAEVTSQQTGARISLTMQISSAALPSSGFAIIASGYVDNRDRSGEMRMNMNGLPGAPELPGGGDGTIQMIFQYPVIYMDMPLLAGKLPEGKTWLKLDLSKAAAAAGMNLSQLPSFDETNPTQLLEYLRASSGGVATVGSESLDGVPTTHYRATLELSSILNRLPSSEQAAAKSALETLGDAGAIPVDVWVDAQDRVRRVQMSIGVSSPAGTAGSVAGAAPSVSDTVTIDFTSFGSIPPITPPPASEVFDASTLTAPALAQGEGG
jgi:hypothetical protein